MHPTQSTCSSYAVTVTGSLLPALRAELASMHMVTTTPASTVMQLRPPTDLGPADVAEILGARGIVLLSARVVHEPLNDALRSTSESTLDG